MNILKGLQPESVFRYFEEICAVPRGSGNREGISRYCMETAKKLGLSAKQDEAQNVVIYKPASKGYEGAEPIILQGHMDMVCQKKPYKTFDFELDGIQPLVDGDWVCADGTTLGADNGIAMAMMLAILEDKTLAHPPIEALFTADEEIGLLGAAVLDGSWFQGKRLINLDSEEADTITVSCAGGSEVMISLPLERVKTEGTKMEIWLEHFRGGHSGVEIDKGRVNPAILLGRVLNHLQTPFALCSVGSGDKANAIPRQAEMCLLTSDPEALAKELMQEYWEVVRAELSEREPMMSLRMQKGEVVSEETFTMKTQEALVSLLTCTPNGIMEMSKSIPNLVETSLNLGVLQTAEKTVELVFALRSNKQSSLVALEERMIRFAKMAGCHVKTSGHYPPWEYKKDSHLRRVVVQAFEEQYGDTPKIEAIHAGLECGVLAAKIKDLDCVSIGPDMKDVHTTEERVSVPSVAATYQLLIRILSALK